MICLRVRNKTIHLHKNTIYMQLYINNETSTLKSVVLGQPGSLGRVPTLEETYDAKSYETVSLGIYPREEDVYKEMNMFERVLSRYNVQIFRPWTLDNCNQIFARDVGFVINDKVIVSNIIPDREDEKEAYETVYNQIAYNKIYNLPEKAHVEGGDIVLYDDLVFVGMYSRPDYSQMKTARTNSYAFDFLKEVCPEKTFIPLELKKSNVDPWNGVLHLDCTFMPVSKGKAIIYKEGFLDEKSYETVVDVFGKANLFHITQEEMYHMNTNVFSISPQVVVSEQRFDRLNRYLEEEWSMVVERVPYHEISKMGGLLRCSTFPLIRAND